MRYLLVLILCTIITAQVSVDHLTDFYKQWLPNLDFDVDSGYVKINSLDGHKDADNQLFYQFTTKKGVKAADITSDQPLIVWLQGGPGCGGATGLYLEIGPFLVIEDAKGGDGQFSMTIRPQSWNNQAHLLFLDQPFGSGFSYSNYESPNSTHTAAKYFADFMTQFLNAYPKLQNNPIYLFGESYAGHYIPSFARELLNNPIFSQYKKNYKGVGIGDGLVQALNQVSYYSQYLFSAGLIDDHLQLNGLNMQAQVQQNYLNGKLAEASRIQDEIISGLTNASQISVYNFWQSGASDSAVRPHNLFLLKYKGDKMHVPAKSDNPGCNQTIYDDFGADIAEDFSLDVLYLLDQGQVLLYNGQLDFIINTPGALQWINALQWSKINQWKQQEKQIFKLASQTVGTYKQFDQFTFATIYQAGHLVPMDQPDVAYAMLTHFLNQDTIWQ